MAWYQITRKCGHTEDVQIYGTNVRGERERRAAWEATLDCFTCGREARAAQHAELSERATATARAEGWPQLAGSPKQVAWAQDIRATAVAELAARIADPAELAVWVAAALRQTDSRWWIDRRGLIKPIRGLRDAVEEAGAARARYGDIAQAVEATMTDADREQLRAIATAAADTEPAAADTEPAADGDEPPATPQAAIGALRAAGWTVAKLAAEIGVHTSTVYRWAAGTRTPNPRNANALNNIRS